MRRLMLLAALMLAGKAGATGEINVLTDLNSPFPPGCVAVSLPQSPSSADNTLHNVTVPAPSIGSASKDARVRVTIWRTGCHDSGYSIVMVRLEKTSGEYPVLVPQVFAEAGDVEFPYHKAQLITHPAVGDVGGSGDVIAEGGRTFMLAVEPFAIDGATTFTPFDYNDEFTLELFWGAYDPADAPEGELFGIDSYEPSLDPTQDEFPVLHGRMSGLYVFDGIPASGLVLMVGEQLDDTNFLQALFFTYRNGAPLWLAGNTGGETPGFDIVDLDMERLSGGEFFTAPPGSFSEGEDVVREPFGTVVIEALDCNRLLVGYDFTGHGLGTGVLEAQRLVRIAGYDCNPWE